TGASPHLQTRSELISDKERAPGRPLRRRDGGRGDRGCAPLKRMSPRFNLVMFIENHVNPIRSRGDESRLRGVYGKSQSGTEFLLQISFGGYSDLLSSMNADFFLIIGSPWIPRDIHQPCGKRIRPRTTGTDERHANLPERKKEFRKPPFIKHVDVSPGGIAAATRLAGGAPEASVLPGRRPNHDVGFGDANQLPARPFHPPPPHLSHH